MQHENLRPGQTQITKVGSTGSEGPTLSYRAGDKPFQEFLGGLLGLGVTCLFLTFLVFINPVVKYFDTFLSGLIKHKSVATGWRYPRGSAPIDSRSFTFCAEWQHKDCLQAAPHPRFTAAAFTFQDPQHANASIVFVLTSSHVSIRVVGRLPDDVLKNGIVVTSGLQVPIPTGHPLIFDGAVNVETGPLADENEMVSWLSHRNSHLTSIDTLYTEMPRGPPSVGKSSEDLPPQVVYVVGNVRHYKGPTQTDHSSHRATVIDLDLSPTPEQIVTYHTALTSWHRKLAEDTGIPESLLTDVHTEHQALKRIAEIATTGLGAYRPIERPHPFSEQKIEPQMEYHPKPSEYKLIDPHPVLHPAR